jgi:hypothetical protein
MKYLLMIIAAMAFVGSATATSESDGCCPGACCLIAKSCCAK